MNADVFECLSWSALGEEDRVKPDQTPLQEVYTTYYSPNVARLEENPTSLVELLKKKNY